MDNKYNSDELRKTLINIGLAKDDNIFIHASLKTIGKYEDLKQPDLLNVIKKTIFDIIRKHEGSKRTYHPIHSISLLGKNSNHVASLKGDTEFSEGSSFDYLLKINCKILFLGDSFTETFFHIAEEKAKVPYRFWKTFRGVLIKNSIKKEIQIKYYARNLEDKPEPQIYITKLFDFLNGKNIFIKSNNKKINLMICSSNSYVNNCLNKLKENHRYFLKD